MSVQTLVSSPLTKDMIAGAIMQSGGGYNNGLNRDDITLEKQEYYGEILTKMAGIHHLHELRQMPDEDIMKLFDPWMKKVFPESHGLFLVPTIDDYVLKAGYTQLMDENKLKKIPYLLGCNKDDILSAPETRGELSPLYKGCVQFSHKLQENGNSPAFVYLFNRDLPGDDAGAFHSAELWYTFGTLNRAWRPFTEHDYQLSEQMMDYWESFIKTGRPERPGEKWELCSKESPYVKMFE